MFGLFLASLGLAAVVAAVSLAAPRGITPRAGGSAVHADVAVQTLRFWTLYSASFGALGAGLTMLVLPGPGALLIAAIVAAPLARGLWSALGDASADVGLNRLVGREGRVVLPVGAVPGKIVLQTQAARIELPARSDDGARIERGCRVFVAFIEDGVAAVVRLRGP